MIYRYFTFVIIKLVNEIKYFSFFYFPFFYFNHCIFLFASIKLKDKSLNKRYKNNKRVKVKICDITF